MSRTKHVQSTEILAPDPEEAQYGAVWYAKSSVAASGDGKSEAGAFKTLTEAVAAVAARRATLSTADAAIATDLIVARGAFTESVTVASASVTIKAVGTCPRDACYWNPVAGNDKVNLTINAAYVRVENIYFRPGAKSATYSACIVLGTAAQHAQIVKNRFQGSTGAYYAIYSPVVGADNAHIEGNEFRYFNTATNGAAILGVNAGGFQYSGWHIVGNVFSSCLRGIKLSCKAALIKGNVFQKGGVTAAGATNAAVMTLGIDLTGDDATNSGGNTVTGNTLDGAYTTALYVPGTTGDCWFGNYAPITATTAPYGLSVANPTS